MKEERFLHTGKPPHWRGLKGSFRALEESAAASLWQPEQRENCTDGQCRCPALPRVTCAGRGWVLELRLRRLELGRGLGLAIWRQTGRLESSATTAEGVRGGSLGHHRGQSPLFGRWGGSQIVAFFPMLVFTEGRTLPAQAPGEVVSHHCCPLGLKEWLQAASTTRPDASSDLGPPPSPSLTPGVVESLHHLPPRPQKWSRAAATTLTNSRSGREPQLPPTQAPGVVASHNHSHHMLQGHT